jgi:hypothetical protein
MIRRKLPKQKIGLPLPYELIEFLFEQENPSDLIALCTYYCLLAIQQNTNEPETTVPITTGTLHWSAIRLKRTKQLLKILNVIKETRHASKTGIEYCIKLPFLSLFSMDGSYPVPNDSVIYNITSSISKAVSLVLDREENNTGGPDRKITSTMFDKFWQIYPKKIDKGKTQSKWLIVCKRPDSPTWRQVKVAILQQKTSERWQESKFIPHPATWLNQRRWLDDPKEMKKICFDQTHSGPDYKMYDGRKYSRCPDGEYRNAAGEIYID